MRYKERRFTQLFKAVSFALMTLIVVATFSVRSQAQEPGDDFIKGEVVVEIKPELRLTLSTRATARLRNRESTGRISTG